MQMTLGFSNQKTAPPVKGNAVKGNVAKNKIVKGLQQKPHRQMTLDFSSQKTAPPAKNEIVKNEIVKNEIVKGLQRKPHYSLQEASQFLGETLRALKRRKDLWIGHGVKGMITYCDMFQANLHDVKMGYGKRHPELEHIYNIMN